MPQVAVPVPRLRLVRSRWFLFHLADLDAPAVAVAWQFLFSKAFFLPVSIPAAFALALSVWLIYAADRLLDVRRGLAGLTTERHRFHQVHRRRFVVLLAAAFIVLGLVCSLLKPTVFRGGLVLGFGILIYMGAVHLLPYAVKLSLPKEINVGVLFAIGTCLAPACSGAFRPSLLVSAALFAALCCLNCCAIEVWEWGDLGGQNPHRLTRFLVQRLQVTLWMLVALASILFFVTGPERLYAAVILSALGFIAVASLRGRISSERLRVLVDLPLLSPVLFLLFAAR